MDIAFLIYDFGIASYTYAYFGYLGFSYDDHECNV